MSSEQQPIQIQQTQELIYIVDKLKQENQHLKTLKTFSKRSKIQADMS